MRPGAGRGAYSSVGDGTHADGREGAGDAREDVPESAPESALESALERSERVLQEASAGHALCRIDGSGGPTPFAVKSAEGGRAALADVRRAYRRDAGRGVRGAAVTTLERWRADLDRWRERGAGPWIAYCEGGCSSVEALIADLATASAGIPDDASASGAEP